MDFWDAISRWFPPLEDLEMSKNMSSLFQMLMSPLFVSFFLFWAAFPIAFGPHNHISWSPQGRMLGGRILDFFPSRILLVQRVSGCVLEENVVRAYWSLREERDLFPLEENAGWKHPAWAQGRQTLSWRRCVIFQFLGNTWLYLERPQVVTDLIYRKGLCIRDTFYFLSCTYLSVFLGV